jgi:hypothetical protein
MNINIPGDVAAILFLAFALGEAYSYVLRPLQHVYNPHWTWVTVVIGVVLTWIPYVALAWRGYIAWEAVWWFVAVFTSTGEGILRWQLGQLRDLFRRGREKERNGRAQAAGRGGDHPAAP